MELTIQGESYRERILASLDWLVLSQTRTGTGGSAAYWSPLLGWGYPYPETSGYIIPTLWRGNDYEASRDYCTAAIRMTDWLLSLQHRNGWFQGGIEKKRINRQQSIFNTGQILFGLAETFRRNGDLKVRNAVERGLNWLCREQEEDGRWLKHAYVKGYSPNYNAHVCWAMAQAAVAIGDESYFENVRCGLTALLKDRNENGTFCRWAFNSGEKAFTHTIGYTLQGIIEASILTGDWAELGEIAADSAKRLMRKFELRKHLAGAYDQNWGGSHWYICLTGHCQIASTWMRIYDRNGDVRFLNAASKLIESVCNFQKLDGPKARRGAIAGSAPIYGDYMRFRYPNWAAKFFVDAMMTLESKLQDLSHGPIMHMQNE